MTKPQRDQPITIEDEINELAREIGVRERVFPTMIAAKKMQQSTADRRIATMTQTLRRLRKLKEADDAASTLV